MDATHRLSIANAAMAGRIVISGVDINKSQPASAGIAAAIPPFQEAHLPQAERTTAVVKDGELGHGPDPRQPGRRGAGRG